MKKVRYSYQKKVANLANKLSKISELSFSECWKLAHKTVGTVICDLIQIVSTKGSTSLRVVARNLGDVYTPSGTGRPKPKGLYLFAELAKVVVKKNPVISTYKYQKVA